MWKETKDAFLCLTIGQVFTADWLASLCCQKRNHSARAGHNTGSHQSQSECWLVQQSSSWHSHKKAANVSSRHASHNSHAGWSERQLTAWWDLLRWHTMPISSAFSWKVACFFLIFFLDVSGPFLPAVCTMPVIPLCTHALLKKMFSWCRQWENFCFFKV